ncbi:response regulator transcription factor [Candidatus Saccharibacteria bacterium]|jgi:DNA-binding response OmpR family regulator|nr:response regulator transcription factor [Candidatus Saccharibacteria bacterium]MBR3256503.1 response regulator transcription factor [Candidatus Saccharibacteria bacterium]
MRVLYVEDATFLAEAVKHNLEKQGITVDLVNDGEAGLENAMSDIYDCVVLDIMLPKLSGTDILKRMREKNVQTPVIMLSALSEVETKISHLDHGADDYLAKPFKTAELVARIKALVRRPKTIDISDITYGDLVLDKTNATLNGEQLTAKEIEIIAELVKSPEVLISKEHLLAKVWGEDGLGEDNYIESYMSRIRKLLKKIHSKTRIVTIRGLGYKLTSK